MHRKPHLPEKTCATCGRPFAWRRKWARDWEAVRHCSDACRSGRHPAARKKMPEIAPTPLAPLGKGR